MTNKAMPGLVKIGYTENDVEKRRRELSNTSVPYPFEIFAIVGPGIVKNADKTMHNWFPKSLRVNDNREFFNITPEYALEIIEENVRHSSVFGVECVVTRMDSQTSKQQSVKRSSDKPKSYTFLDVGINNGDIITCEFDKKDCVVVDAEKRLISDPSNPSMQMTTSAYCNRVKPSVNGKKWSWTGTRHFFFKGKTILQIAREMGLR